MPCKHEAEGGTDECVLNAQRVCIVRHRQRSREYRAANPEKVREQRRRGYAANPEKNRERARKWHAANREKAREKKREWRAANPDAHYRREYGITFETKQRMYESAKGLCRGCGQPMTFEESELDHCESTSHVRGLLGAPITFAITRKSRMRHNHIA